MAPTLMYSCASSLQKIQTNYKPVYLLRYSGLLPSKGAAVAQHIHKSGGYDTIDIQNQIWLLVGCDLLHLQGVLQQRTLWEVLHDELLDDLHSHIGIVDRLDAMANTQDEFTLLAHLVDKLHGVQVGVVGLRELSSRTVQSSTETITLLESYEIVSLDSMRFDYLVTYDSQQTADD